MSEHTHCDRCGEVGTHKDTADLTAEFPARVELRTGTGVLITHRRARELCQSCAVDLALFLDDDDLADTVASKDDDAEVSLDGTEDERR